jgi:rhodanese-related sulfurtransferase
MKEKITLIIFLCFMSLFVSIAAQGKQSQIVEITAPEVKAMLKDTNALIINNLSNLEFELQHISGSINIPFDQMSGTDKLPKDKNRSIIFYCMASL